MNPFAGFFQNAGNFIQQGVTNAKNAVAGLSAPQQPPPQDAAVVAAAAAQASHPQTKAALHQIAADTYSQIANQNSSAPTAPAGADVEDPITHAMSLPAAAVSYVAGLPRNPAGTNAHVKPAGGAVSDAATRVATGFTNPFDPNAAQTPNGTDPLIAAGQFFGSEAMRGSPEGKAAVGEVPAAGRQTAATGEAAVQNARAAMDNAKVQPGGLQAGFVKPDEFTGKPGTIFDAKGNPVSSNTQPVSQPLPQEPSGTSVQFNKDGTENIVPPDQRTNQPQYAQGAPADKPAAPQFQGGQPAINNRESFQTPKPPINMPAGDVPKAAPETTLPGGDPKQIPQRSLDILDNTYTVPAKKAMGNLQKVQTYRGMLTHIKSGMDPAMIEQMPSLVSDSQTGMVPKMIREVGSNIKEPIPLKDPGQAAQNIMDQHKLFIDDKTAADIKSDITSALPKSEDGATVDPLDAIQYARELETRAAEIRQGDNYLTSRGDRRYMAQALNAAADDVWDQIGAHVTPEDLSAVKTPERMTFLHSLSPRLAAQVDKAQNIPQLRSTIRDFVRMGQIVEQTEASSGSVFGKVGRMGLGSRGQKVMQGVGLGVKALYNPVGAAADVAKIGAQHAAGMMDESPRSALLKSLEETQEGPSAHFGDGSSPVGVKQGMGGKGMRKGIKVAGAGLVGAGLIGGGVAGDYLLHGGYQQPSNAEGTDNTESNHGTNLTSSFTKSQDGSLTLPTSVSQPSGQYMTDSQRRAAEANLNLYNPVDKSQYDKIEQEYTQGQARANAALSGNSKEFMQNAPQYTAVGNVVQNDIKNLPTGFLNKFKTWSAVQAYASDPNNPYAGELADLDMMNTQFTAAYNQVMGANPGNNQLITAGDSGTQLQAKWTRMMNFIGDSYSQRLEPYQAVTTTQGAKTSGGQQIQGPAVQPPPPAPADASAIVGGSPPQAPQFKFQSGQAAFAQ